MPANTTINIAIVDDQKLFRQTLKTYLGSIDKFNICFEASYEDDFMKKLSTSASPINVLLVDLGIPVLKNKHTLVELRRSFPTVNVLIMSVFTEFYRISELLDIGINGYVSKFAEIEELIEAIECASSAQLYENKILTDTLYWRTRINNTLPAEKLEIVLTKTEEKVLQLLYEEKNTQEIALEIYTSISSVEKIKQKLKEKTNSKSTVGLIKYGLEKNIITAGKPVVVPTGTR